MSPLFLKSKMGRDFERELKSFQIIKGMFRIDDYDFCVAHTDMASSILPLRGILRSRFPNKINGR